MEKIRGVNIFVSCVADGRDTWACPCIFFSFKKLRQFECLPGFKFQGLHPVGDMIPYTNLYLDYVSFGTSSETHTRYWIIDRNKYNYPLTFFSSLSMIWENLFCGSSINQKCMELAVIKNIQKTTAHTNRQGSSSLNSMKTTKYSKNVGIYFIVIGNIWSWILIISKF